MTFELKINGLVNGDFDKDNCVLSYGYIEVVLDDFMNLIELKLIIHSG